jgi:KamA family protein
MPQVEKLTASQQRDIEVVGNVLPFKASSYVVDKLIDWDNFEEDPFFILSFPQREMLTSKNYAEIDNILKKEGKSEALKRKVEEIRLSLNPNSSGQSHNVPKFEGNPLKGVQHKYNETMLFFPVEGQTCHAFCTFCFRWPQFTLKEVKFSLRDTKPMIGYLKAHPEIQDVLITGGDPGIMRTKIFEKYFRELTESGISHLHTIRIGTKALTYWPQRFTTNNDADDLLRLFENTVKKGINISIMAHFNHPRALETPEVEAAIKRLLSAGVQIRSQSPVLKHINDSSEVWSSMWRKQVDMGIIPYYMFIARDTGAREYFAVSLEDAFNIYTDAYRNVSGLCRTVRGPSMSCDPGKVHIIGLTEVMGQKVFVLRFIQGRNSDWVNRTFFAKYNPNAYWISDLEPAFGEKEFFFTKELQEMYKG